MKIKNSFLLLLLISNCFSQNATLDLEFSVPFDLDSLITKKIKRPHDLDLNRLDREAYVEYFNKHIKDTADYTSYVFCNDGSWSNYAPERFLKCAREKDASFFSRHPTLYNQGEFYLLSIYERLDSLTGDTDYDEYGDPFYDTVIEEFSVHNHITSINSYEDWSINVKGFHKKIRTLSSSLLIKNESGDYSPVSFKSFFNVLKPRLKTADTLMFKQNVSYDYLFFPTHVNGSKELCLEKGSNQSDVVLKKYDEDLYGASRFEVEAFVYNIFVALELGNAIILDSNDNKINYPSGFLNYRMNLDSIEISRLPPLPEEISYGPRYFNPQKPYNVEDVAGFHFTEDWYFAKNDYGLVKKVKAIQLLVINYDDEGNADGCFRLPFKIIFNNKV